MSRIGDFTGIINNEIQYYKDKGLPVPLSKTIEYLKTEGVNLNKYTLTQRCKFKNASYE